MEYCEQTLKKIGELRKNNKHAYFDFNIFFDGDRSNFIHAVRDFFTKENITTSFTTCDCNPGMVSEIIYEF